MERPYGGSVARWIPYDYEAFDTLQLRLFFS